MDDTQPVPEVGPGPVESMPEPPPAPPSGDPEAALAVATEPVTVAPRARPRGLVRWGVAFGVLAVMIGVVSVGAVMLAAGGRASAVQGWLPPGTLAYLELRADLPGDQRQGLSDLLARFPGFKDQAALDQKLDTVFDALFRKADISYSAEVKPWLQGEVGLVVTKDLLPTVPSFNLGTDLSGLGFSSAIPLTAVVPTDGAVVLIATTDPAKAEAWIAGEVKATPTTETYAGVELKVVDRDGSSFAWTVKDRVLFIGTKGTLKAALDTGGKSPVAASTAFKDARATATGDYLGFAYLDSQAVMDWYMGLLNGLPTQPGLSMDCLKSSLKEIPGWLAGVTRIEPDAVVVDMAAPAVTRLYQQRNGPSQVARHLPASTVFAVGGRQAGESFVAAWDAIKEQFTCLGTSADSIKQIDQALGVLGGVKGLVGWAEDLGFAVTTDGTTWGGGLVLTSADPADPKRTGDQLGTLISLAGGQLTGGLSIGKEPYGDGTLYTIKTGSDPSAVTLAMTGQRGVLAVGTLDFVKAVVDTTEANSLAGVDRYAAAIKRAGGDGTAEMYLDLAGLRDRIVALVPAEAKAKYEADVAPYLAPFDVVAMVSKVGDRTETVRLIVTVK